MCKKTHATHPFQATNATDTTTGVDGREAQFLFHESITAARIPGLTESFGSDGDLSLGLHGSYCAPHDVVDAVSRTTFGEELAASATHRLSIFPATLAGGANVWLLDFLLGWSRSIDNVFFPNACGLVLVNAREQATHVAGPALLDFVLVSGSEVPDHFTVHPGDSCCPFCSACCPALGSDHFLCVFS